VCEDASLLLQNRGSYGNVLHFYVLLTDAAPAPARYWGLVSHTELPSTIIACKDVFVSLGLLVRRTPLPEDWKWIPVEIETRESNNTPRSITVLKKGGFVITRAIRHSLHKRDLGTVVVEFTQVEYECKMPGQFNCCLIYRYLYPHPPLLQEKTPIPPTPKTESHKLGRVDIAKIIQNSSRHQKKSRKRDDAR